VDGSEESAVNYSDGRKGRWIDQGGDDGVAARDEEVYRHGQTAYRLKQKISCSGTSILVFFFCIGDKIVDDRDTHLWLTAHGA